MDRTVVQPPARAADYRVVEGHTDSQPIRTAWYPTDWQLSGARATAPAA